MLERSGIANKNFHSYIHTFINSHIHSFIHTFIHTYIHSLIHTFVHSFTHSFIHTFIHSCRHIFIHSCTQRFNKYFLGALWVPGPRRGLRPSVHIRPSPPPRGWSLCVLFLCLFHPDLGRGISAPIPPAATSCPSVICFL